jgi:hypothetical protein
MTAPREGGCVCGAVRYRVRAAPVRTSACNCRFCQRRTGSAFGMGAFFRVEDVEFLAGTLKVFETRSDESKRWLRFEFCEACGTQVTWTVEALPGMRSIGIGTFDDPSWPPVERFSWMRSAHPWVTVPPGVERFEQSGIPPAAPPAKT